MNSGVKTLLALVVAAGLALLGWYTYFDWHKDGGANPTGGDDQPPIIVGDGSVDLFTWGAWTKQGSHYISEDYAGTEVANWLDVRISGSSDPKCSKHFVTRTLTLTGTDGTNNNDDNYQVAPEGKSGKTKVEIGNSTATVDGQILKLTYGPNPWWLKTISDGSDSCSFTQSDKPNILISPFVRPEK